ncbi:hypothetical protein WAK64_13890 [Bacillus spongiae]|uniref:Uncharacterized protein n=1 Tax=Bacillus spongiae TaxID=2683610 RepID=A0ABU8HG13_9BACI
MELGFDILLVLLLLFLVTIFFFSATFAVIFLFQRGKCDKKDNCLCFIGPFIAIAAVAIALGLIIAGLEVGNPLPNEVSSTLILQKFI